MFDLYDLAHGSWVVGVWIQGIKGKPECRGFQGYTIPQTSYLMSLGVLTSLGDMPSCRYPFLYAQEATRLPQLLEAVGWLMITIVLTGDVSILAAQN